MEQGPQATNSERPVASAPAPQEAFWVPNNTPEESTYHQRLGNQDVLVTDKRRINLLPTNEAPSGPRVELTHIGDQELLITDKRGIRPREESATFEGSTLENGFGERREEMLEPRVGREPNHAEDHHSRVQDSKRPENSGEAKTPPVSVTMPEKSESSPNEAWIQEEIEDSAKLKELQRIAQHYGEAKAIAALQKQGEAKFAGTPDVEGLKQRYEELKQRIQDRHKDPAVLKWIESEYVLKQPAEERLTQILGEKEQFYKEFRNPQKKPTEVKVAISENSQVNEKPTESLPKADEPTGVEVAPSDEPVEPPAETPAPEAGSSPTPEVDPNETKKKKPEWRENLELITGEAAHRLSRSRFFRIFNLGEKARKHSDPESPLTKRANTATSEEERRQKQERANVNDNLGVVARVMRRYTHWVDRTAGNFFLATKRYQSVNDQRDGQDSERPADQLTEGEK